MPKDDELIHQMTLRVVTPEGVAFSADCDSITLPLADDSRGAGGGSIGIRRGHAKAELALGAGRVRAYNAGSLMGGAQISSGFAMVERDTVTVISDSARKDTAPELRK